MKKAIVTDPIYLRNVSTEAMPEEINGIIQDLEDSLDLKGGIGLAGVQIGILKRVAIIRIGDTKTNLINAYIVEKDNKFRMQGEGCLSIPNLHVDTTRYNYIVINNNGQTETYRGLVAVAIQHEIGHFLGKTILDYKWKSRA
jgi:peptide deformylase